jgi:methyl-accepting chemotaxis protein
MLNRFSVDMLLKTIVGALALIVVAAIGARVLATYGALSASERILDVANASDDAFTAMLNIRSDRSSVPRTWNTDAPVSRDVKEYIRPLQTAEMGALRSALARLEQIDFADRATLLPALAHTQERLAALQAEFWEGIDKPKAQRRAALAADYLTEGLALQDTLEKISARIFASVRGLDAFVDEMLDIKQLAWLARDRAGEGSLLISNGLTAGKLPAEAQGKYDTYAGGAAAAWSAIDSMLATLKVPESFTAAVADTRRVVFAPDYAATRVRLLNALINGGKPEMTADEWSPYTVTKMGKIQDVASGALGVAREHATTAHTGAFQLLVQDGALLIGTVLLAAFSLVIIGRRVTGPLHQLRDAMLLLAGGDLTVEAPFPDRRDEIGALASALATFRAAAVDKAHIEAEQEERRTQQAARQQAMDARIGVFEGDAGAALSALGGASAEMGQASVEMAAIAGRTTARVREATAASEEASGSVAGIAAATEELSASIAEIGRQVARATEITGRAVEETRQTDSTVRGLSEAAAKIGEVVKLISDIAGQTNLLALNATIEAARAGEAGKGFAVVASEVKSLASQTAKATEEIAAQIAAVRDVTEQAVGAIRRIGATVDEVSTVATSIAAGVEQQGAATQEIARGTQEAARRTERVSESVAGVRDDADATGATAETVKLAATTLQTQADRLRGRVEDFLGGIKAA